MRFYQHPSFQFIFTAFALVVAIAVMSNAITTLPLERAAGNDLVLASEADVQTRLMVESVGKGGDLNFGSQEEVYRFSIDATGPYTLRYMTFSVESEGLREDKLHWADNWMLYPVEKGEVDYTQPIGQGERWQDGLLQVKLFSPEADGYFGEATKQVFALSTYALSSGEEESWMQVHFAEAKSLPYSFDWAWTSGHYFGSWLRFEGELGAGELDGLPSTPLEWN